MRGIVAVFWVVAAICTFCAVCGCMDAGEGTDMSVVVITTEPTPAPDSAEGGDEWTVWREGRVSIGRLGEFQTYKPNKNGGYFHALKVEVDSSGPLALFFLTPEELVNFKNKMMTNAGDYYPVATYEDVTSGTYTCVSDDDLTIALLNEGKHPVTGTVNIWYQE